MYLKMAAVLIQSLSQAVDLESLALAVDLESLALVVEMAVEFLLHILVQDIQSCVQKDR